MVIDHTTEIQMNMWFSIVGCVLGMGTVAILYLKHIKNTPRKIEQQFAC